MRDYSLTDTILDVKNVSLTLGNNLILRNVNVSVKNVVRPAPITQGQVIAFLGPSGRGKTQLSKILAGLQPATSGEVMIDYPPVPVKKGKVGYVTQNYLLRRNRTLIGNLVLAGKQNGLSSRDAKLKAEEYAALFELSDHSEKYPSQLSGGQRQRVAIAQQLLCSDHYLIMDEPFSGLDPIMKEKVCELIIRVSLMDELNTIVVISHDVRAVLKVSDTAWMLGQDRGPDGKLIPGSYIKRTVDLMESGYCWNPGVFNTAGFNTLVQDVEAEFKRL